MTTIQVRVDKKIKSAASKQFEKMGLDMSTGVKMFLSQVVRTKSIPFPKILVIPKTLAAHSSRIEGKT